MDDLPRNNFCFMNQSDSVHKNNGTSIELRNMADYHFLFTMLPSTKNDKLYSLKHERL